MEAISPELVLVDPELAARVRASAVAGPPPHLLSSTEVAPFPSESAPRQPVRSPEAADGSAPTGRRHAFRRARRSLVAVGLLVSGFFAGAALSGSGTERPEFVLESAGTARTVEKSRSAGSVAEARRSRVGRTKRRVRPAAKERRRAGSRARRATATPKRRRQTGGTPAAERRLSAVVERKLLSLIVHSPAGKLPPVLIQKRTGLAKNNLQAVCRRSDDRRSFLCIVTSALQPTAPPVYSLYRPTKTGRGGFTWYHSRDG